MKIYPFLMVITLLFCGVAHAENAMLRGGQGSDPALVWPQISIMVTELATKHKIPESQAQDFADHLLLSYNQRRISEGDMVRQSLSGKLTFPVCSETQSRQSVAFKVDMRVEAAYVAILPVGDTLRDSVESALMNYVRSCPMPISQE